MYEHIILFVVAIFIGILLSNVTEEFLSKPAERFMNLVAGYGLKGQDAEFNEKGVPIVSLRRLRGKYSNPVAVSMGAFQHYENWRSTKDEQYFKYFKNCADWLVDSLKFKTFNKLTYGVWEYDYPWSYNLKPPWISGLAQGVGIQVLSRAYKLTREKKYLKIAKYALNTFFIEVRDGGVTYKDNENEWWYEEYIGKNAKISRVLNGMVYAVIGTYEYYKNTGDEEAKQLFEKGVQSLKRNLAKYDAGWWTYYDNLGLIATKSYHAVHLDLIKRLYEITGENFFLEMHNKWSKYKTKFFIREFIKQKPSYHDIVILTLNIIGIFILLEVVTFILSSQLKLTLFSS